MLKTLKSFCQLYGYHRNFKQKSYKKVQTRLRWRFQQFITQVMLKSEYYGKVGMALSGDPFCLESWPVLTKDEYINNFNRIVTDSNLSTARLSHFISQAQGQHDLLDDKYIVLHTSGTSGQMAYFAYTYEEWLKGGLLATRISPIWPPRKRVAYVAATDGHYTGITLMRNSEVGINKLWYNVLPIDTNMPTADIVEQLNGFQPRILAGYAQTLVELSRHPALSISPKLLVSSGEMLSKEHFNELRKRFGVPINNVYASTECQYMGCSYDGEPMVLFEDNLIIEVFPDCTLITNLNNQTTPLVRYKLEDVLQLRNLPGHNKGFRTVQPVVARDEEMLRLRDNTGQMSFIHPIVFAELHVPGLIRWQVRPIGERGFDILVEVSDAAAIAGLRRKVNKILAGKLMQSVKLKIRRVRKIEPESGGKFKLIKTD